MARSSKTYPDVPGQGLYFSGELHTLLLQLLPFLHIAAQLQLLFSCLIHRTFQHLDLILLVLDQLTFQLYLAGGCKKRIITIIQRTGFSSGFTSGGSWVAAFNLEEVVLWCTLVLGHYQCDKA